MKKGVIFKTVRVIIVLFVSLVIMVMLVRLKPEAERQVPKQTGLLVEANVLQKQMSEFCPDLLVLGTHGRTGVAHATLGSVAIDFLKDPPCDVLVTKA